MGSGPRASSGHQAVKEGLSSLPEVDVSGSEGILNMWIAVFSQSLPPHSTHSFSRKGGKPYYELVLLYVHL